MDTLAFGYILPATGRIRDFHPLETCAARRTSGKGGVASFATPFLLLHERFTMVILHKDEEIFKKIEKRY